MAQQSLQGGGDVDIANVDGNQKPNAEEKEPEVTFVQRAGKSIIVAADKTSEWMKNQRKVIKYRLRMEGMLQSARESFEQIVERNKDAMDFELEKGLATHQWDKATAVVFVTEVRAGFTAIGIKGNTAVMVVRIKGEKEQKDRWSAPIPLKGGGISLGFVVGASKVDRIMVLTSQEQIQAFLNDGDLLFNIGANAEATALVVGRSGDVGYAINTDAKGHAVWNYSMSCKGLFAGVAVRGSVWNVSNKTMCAFHGEPVTVKDIVNGTVQAPTDNDDYNQIIALLTLLEGQQKTESVVDDQ